MEEVLDEELDLDSLDVDEDDEITEILDEVIEELRKNQDLD